MPKIHESGFTIIELIIATVLFVVVVPAIAGMISSAGYVNKKSVDYTLINNLAEEKIESLRGTGYANLVNGTTDFADELPASLSPPNSASYVISDQDTHIKKIAVTISYTYQEETKTFHYTSFVSENGLGQ
ncbi:hypothetical protein KC953_00810 [Candidatus Saccharibacteria bacterium]|nr:hypothetical protein [Candidatus Saccharibacteria bacterium]